MEITPVQAVPNSTPALPADGYNGQKLERGANEAPRLVVDRRQSSANAQEDAPRQAKDKASQDKDAVEQAADKLNKLMGFINKRMQFSVHDKSHRIMVKIVNSDSGDVLSEIPSEKMLDLYASLVEAIGIAVDEKV